MIGIVVITVISFFVTDPETGNPVAGFQPGAYGIFDEIPSLAPVAFQLDLAGAFRLSLLLPIFSLFFVDFFDTVGGFVGIASKAGMIDERGDLKMEAVLWWQILRNHHRRAPGHVKYYDVCRECGRDNAGETGDRSRGCTLLLRSAVSVPIVFKRAFRCNRTLLIIVDPYCSSLSEIDWHYMSLRSPASDIHHDAAVFFLAPAVIGFIIMSDPVLTGKYKEVHRFMNI